MRTRTLHVLPLEDRLAPAVGDLLHTLSRPASALQFGYALAANNQYVVVGSTSDTVSGVSGAGAAHLFNASTGAFVRTIPNPTPQSGDQFGYSVAIAGDVVLVGAPIDNTDGAHTGAAYLFQASTGNLIATLHNPTPDASTYEWYGCSVGLTGGGVALVGAYLEKTVALYAGAVYKFDASNGQPMGQLAAPEPEGGDDFGFSIAVGGGRIAIGSATDEVSPGPKDSSGGVHLYDESTLTWQRSIYNPTPHPLDFFGCSVGLSGNNLVIGAYSGDAGTTADAGTAYVYNAATGGLIRTLSAPTPTNGDRFGNGVAISGDTVIVGAPYNDAQGSDNGVGFIFDAPSGTRLATMDNPVTSGTSFFGYAVAAKGANLYLGAYWSGNAYIYEGRPLGPPDALDDNPSVQEDAASFRIEVLGNDTSPTGDIHVTGVTQGTHGDVAISADGLAVEYTPHPDYYGSDTFTYTVTDGGGSDTANANVTVTSVNDDPNARDDQITLDTNANPTPISVLDNDDSAPDTGETLTIAQVTQGHHGSVVITGSGTGLTYEPDTGYTGADAFTYMVADGNGGFDVAIVAVSIQNPADNNPPDAVDDTADLIEDGQAQTILVLDNDSTDPDVGEVLKVSTVTQGQHGTVAIAADKLSITYTPFANFAGNDSFLYAISDGRGGIDYAAVNVVVANDVADRLEVVTNPVTLDFTEGEIQKIVDGGLRVSTVNQGISRALIKITSGYVKGRDFLVVPVTKGLKAAFNRTTGTLTLSGTALTLNPEAILRGVSFKNTSPAPVAGVRTISIAVADKLGVGDPAYRKIDVEEINTPPTLTLTAPALTFKENGKPLLVASTIKATDADNTLFTGAMVGFLENFAPGQDVLSVTPRAGVIPEYDSDTGILTLAGTAKIADYVAMLRSVRYTNTSDGPSTLPRKLSFGVTDGTHSSLAALRIVNVTAVNDAPVLDASANPSLPNVNAGDTNPSGATAASLLGTSVADPDVGALQGIAVIGFSGAGNGTWEYSLNDGATWQAITGVSLSKGLLLRATDRIRFVPAVGFTGQQIISYRAWDQSTGAAGQLATLGVGGGTTAFSVAYETATVVVV